MKTDGSISGRAVNDLPDSFRDGPIDDVVVKSDADDIADEVIDAVDDVDDIADEVINDADDTDDIADEVIDDADDTDEIADEVINDADDAENADVIADEVIDDVALDTRRILGASEEDGDDADADGSFVDRLEE